MRARIRALLRQVRPDRAADGPDGDGGIASSDAVPADQGLFIIGAARSGTTILQNALNDAPEIYLLGEADFHTDPGTPGFAARFNAMHRGWKNQETKSSFCPPVLAADLGWQDYLRQLARTHKLVGGKIAINPVRAAGAMDQLFAFHCRLFFPSRYIFTFRDPLATILSTRDLQQLITGRTDGLPAIMRNYVDAVRLFIRMLRTLPHVRAVCHEDIDRGTFEELGDWLGVGLTGSHRYYEPARVMSYDEDALDDAARGCLAPIRALYDTLRREVARGFATPQLEQNNDHLNPGHLTPLGRLARDADRALAALEKNFGGLESSPPS